MCTSKSQGGQRCATHMRPKYLEALLPAEDKDTLEFSEQILLGAATIPYATTLKGIKAIQEDIARFTEEGKIEVSVILGIALKEGLKQRDETKELELQLYCHDEAYGITEACLNNGFECGLTLWESYKNVTEIADQLVENITLESAIEKVAPEIATYRIRIAQNISYTMKQLALDYYAYAASTDEVSQALLERDSNQEGFKETSIELDPKDLEDLHNSIGIEGIEKGKLDPQEE